MIRVDNYSCICEKGIRENNEDFICPDTPDTEKHIFVLCDGMGGHGHGEVASETVCTAVYEYLKAQNAETYTEQMFNEALAFAVEELNKRNTFNDGQKQMGTTLVVAAVNNDDILVGHIGDSRCYLFSAAGKKLFRTTDHSQVAEAVAYRLITEEEAFNHPKKNILTRCVQPESEHPAEMTFDRLADIHDGDMILLCSDGVNDALRDAEIEDIIGHNGENRLNELKQKCRIMSRDNFSAILLTLRNNETKNPANKRDNQQNDVQKQDVSITGEAGGQIGKNAPNGQIKPPIVIRPDEEVSARKTDSVKKNHVLLGIIFVEALVILLLCIILFLMVLPEKKDLPEFPEHSEQIDYRLYNQDKDSDIGTKNPDSRNDMDNEEEESEVKPLKKEKDNE